MSSACFADLRRAALPRLVLLLLLACAPAAPLGCTADDPVANEPPQLSIDSPTEIDYVIGEGVIRITLTATDAEDQDLYFELLDAPARSEFQTFSRWAIFQWDPLIGDITEGDPHTLIFSVTDEAGARTEKVVRVSVRPGNGVPRFDMDTSFIHDVGNGDPVAFEVRVRDDDSSSVAIAMPPDGAPAGAQLTRTGDLTARFSWMPTAEQQQQRLHTVTFVADDGDNEPVSFPVSIVLRKDGQSGNPGGGGGGGGDDICGFEELVVHQPPGPQRTTEDYLIEASLTPKGAEGYERLIINWTRDDAFNGGAEWRSADMLVSSQGTFAARIPNALLDNGQQEQFFYEICAVPPDSAQGEAGELYCGPTSSFYSFAAYPPDQSSCVSSATNTSRAAPHELNFDAWDYHHACAGQTQYFHFSIQPGELADIYFTYPIGQPITVEMVDASGQPVDGLLVSSCSGYAAAFPEAPDAPMELYFQVTGDDVPFQSTVFLGNIDPTAGCPDAEMEPNEDTFGATVVPTSPMSFDDLAICTAADVDVFAIDAQAGETIEALLNFTHADGDLDAKLFAPSQAAEVGRHEFGVAAGISGDDDEAITHVAEESGLHWLIVYTYDDPNDYTLDVSVELRDCTDNDVYAGNHTRDDAASIVFGDYPDLTLCPGKADWFDVFALQGDTMIVEVSAQQGQIYDALLELYDGQGNFVEFGQISEGVLRTSFVALTTGSHFVKVSSDAPMTYTISLSVQ